MDKKLVKRSSAMLLGIGAGAALYAVCPPAAIALGVFGFVRGACRFARSPSPDAAREMFMGYGSISGASGHSSDLFSRGDHSR